MIFTYFATLRLLLTLCYDVLTPVSLLTSNSQPCRCPWSPAFPRTKNCEISAITFIDLCPMSVLHNYHAADLEISPQNLVQVLRELHSVLRYCNGFPADAIHSSRLLQQFPQCKLQVYRLRVSLSLLLSVFLSLSLPSFFLSLPFSLSSEQENEKKYRAILLNVLQTIYSIALFCKLILFYRWNDLGIMGISFPSTHFWIRESGPIFRLSM